MERLVKKGLGVTWPYWLFVATFFSLFVLSLYVAATDETEDKRVLIAASVVFFAFGAGGLVWPFLRSREAASLQTEFVHAFDMHCEGVLFPASRAKEVLTLAGSFLLSAGTLAMVVLADTLEHRVKGGVAFVFFACVFILSLKFCFAGRKGVLFVPSGIIWHEMMKPPCFMPWDSVARAALFLKPQKYVSKPALAFGIDVRELTSVTTPKWNCRLIARAKRHHGWHFHFLAETIIVALPMLAGAVQYYLLTPKARGEIGSATSIAKISAMEADGLKV